MKRHVLVPLALFGLVAASCGSSDGDAPNDSSTASIAADDDDEEFDVVTEAEPAETGTGTLTTNFLGVEQSWSGFECALPAIAGRPNAFIDPDDLTGESYDIDISVIGGGLLIFLTTADGVEWEVRQVIPPNEVNLPFEGLGSEVYSGSVETIETLGSGNVETTIDLTCEV